VRVVIDGRALRDDNGLAAVAEHVLGAWAELLGEDNLHLLVDARATLNLPDSITIHRIPRHRFGRSLALPRRCRALRPDVILGLLPSTPASRPVGKTRRRVGIHQADVTVCLSEHIREDLMALSPRIRSLPVRVLVAPSPALLNASAESILVSPAVPAALALSSAGIGTGIGSATRHGPETNRLALVDDAFLDQVALEHAAWVRVAGALRLSLFETVAMISWRAGQFRFRPVRPQPAMAAPLLALPAVAATSASAAPSAARRGLIALSGLRAQRPIRWIGAVSAATLAVSAVSAASVNLVMPVGAPTHALTQIAPASSAATTTATTSVAAPHLGVPSMVPLMTTTTTAPTTPVTAATGSGSTSLSTPTTSTSTPSLGVTAPTVAGISTPTISLPPISVPSLPIVPLPSLSCTGAATTTTTPTTTTPTLPIPLVINLCSLPVAGQVLGAG
jgi:hypothetical protein